MIGRRIRREGVSLFIRNKEKGSTIYVEHEVLGYPPRPIRHADIKFLYGIGVYIPLFWKGKELKPGDIIRYGTSRRSSSPARGKGRSSS